MNVLVLTSTYNLALVNTAAISHSYITSGYDTNMTNHTGTAIGYIIDAIEPIIIFTGATPAVGLTITGNNFKPQFQITDTLTMDTFIYTLNGVTYPYYDSGLVLMMNFDNVALLNESTASIKDVSQYGNNGSGFSGVTRTTDGKWNGSYMFDGIDDYIQVPNVGISSGSFTIM